MTAGVDWQQQLDQGLRQLEETTGALPPDGPERLLQFIRLLQRWNDAYNLSAIRAPGDMVRRHLFDSLVIVPWVPDRGCVLDVGSGAGLPGIPLAIARPGLDLVLLDSNGKKTRFLRQVVMELGLSRVTVVQERIERHQSRSGYDRIVSRAYAALGLFARQVAPLLKPGGRALAMKGHVEEPLGESDWAGEVRVHRLTVPGLDAQRTLVELVPAAPLTRCDRLYVSGRRPDGSG